MTRLTRTIQRTPSLGLTLKMRKPGSATCCEPNIGPVRWYNQATSAFDSETLVLYQFVSDWEPSYLLYASGEDYFSASSQAAIAIVTGELCDCRVEWSAEWLPADGSNLIEHVEFVTADRALVALITTRPGYNDSESAGGVVVATPRITGSSASGPIDTTLAPAYLTIEPFSSYVGC